MVDDATRMHVYVDVVEVGEDRHDFGAAIVVIDPVEDVTVHLILGEKAVFSGMRERSVGDA